MWTALQLEVDVKFAGRMAMSEHGTTLETSELRL